MNRQGFSWSRWVGIIAKEFIQLKRDRLTFGMIIGIPVLQLILFGYAINSDPKRLPTAVLAADSGPYARTLLAAMQTSGYFRLERPAASEAEIDDLLARGRVQFAVTIPENFGRKLERGERPVLLIEADAADPSATGNAIAALGQLATSALARDLQGPLAELAPRAPPFDIRIHRRYNPEGVTAYNIVPGLIGTILTMTMVLMTGKIVPYILIGLIQVTLIILAALLLFEVPMQGNPLLLYLAVLVFIAANLSLGITFSTIARNQLQAMQMTFFFFLPSILLSGFMFPFRGMPDWAQALGSLLPLTHFLLLVRGIMLKGNGLADLAPHLWPILAFMLAVIGIGLALYRRTLD